MMPKHLSDHSISKILLDSAQTIAPEPETCEKILSDVMKASGASGEVNYAEAAARVSALSEAKRLHTLRGWTAFITGITAVAAACLLFSATTNISVNTNHSLIMQQADFVIDIDSPVGSVSAIPDNDVPLAATPGDNSRRYEADQSDARAGSAKGNDLEIPVVESYWWDENYIYIRFADSKSLTAWEQVCAVDQNNGHTAPAELRPEQGIAVFAMPSSDLALFIQDNAGNQIKGAIRIRWGS